MDVFDWSIPFLSENITAVMKILLGGSDNKLNKDEDQKFRSNVLNKIDKDFNKKEIIKKKIRFIGRLSKIFFNLKNNNLVTNKTGLMSEEGNQNVFSKMIKSDARNEGLPGVK